MIKHPIAELPNDTERITKNTKNLGSKTNKMCFARMLVEKGTLPEAQTHGKKLEKYDSSAMHRVCS